MAKSEHIVLSADPDDPEDFDVSAAGLAAGLAEREARRASGGRSAAARQQETTLPIDDDLLARWKAGGADWQSRMIGTLRQVSGSGFVIADAARGQGAGARIDQINT